MACKTAETAKQGCADRGDPAAVRRKHLGRSSRRMAVRDAGVVADRARGKSWATISIETGLSVRRCQQIVEEWRADGLGDDLIDPAAEVRAMVDLLTQAVEDFAVLAASTSHVGWAIAAHRQRIEAAMTRFDLLRAIGVLPRQLGAMTAEQELACVVQAVAEVMRKHAVSDDVLREIVAVCDARVSAKNRALARAA